MSSVPLPAPASLVSTPYEMEALRTLLAKVVENAPASRQKTFFSIGGRGHWENPASDVLAFFLNPDEQHGFGSLFLRVFFDCIGVDATGLDLDTSVQVRTEERLTSDERIDLVLRAPALRWLKSNQARALSGMRAVALANTRPSCVVL